MTTKFLRPGTIGLTQIHGKVGLGIRIGQYLNGNGFENYEHAFVYLGGGKILEAEPGGARITYLSEYANDEVYWCTNIYNLLAPQWPFGPARVLIPQWAGMYDGVPYSFLDYDALLIHRLHVNVPGLQNFIANSGHMICSQLCDDYYRTKLKTKIFTDGRWDGYVTPGALYERDMELAI